MAKSSKPAKKRPAIPVITPGKALDALRQIMVILRSKQGCPWDREQNHQSIRFHAIEEACELVDAIEARDDHELKEELGDVLLQVVFHCQLASERKAFDFDQAAANICEKLIRRHPHVFGDVNAANVEAVWTNWEKIKREEKAGSTHERKSALDGIPKHLPTLLAAQKLLKKAERAGLSPKPQKAKGTTKTKLSAAMFAMVAEAHAQGWSAEELLRAELRKRERAWRKAEAERSL